MQLLRNIIKKIIYTVPSSKVLMFHHVTEMPRLKKSGCLLATEKFYEEIEMFHLYASLEDVIKHPERKKIAITFDDGPHPVWTPKLLEGLKEREVLATFFLIGSNIDGNETVVKEIYENGHIVGNHTFHHVEMTKLSDEKAMEEIRMTNEKISAITGEPVSFMRPPFGAWQKGLEKEMQVLPVNWSVDTLDWTTKNADEIVNKVVTEVKENDIILMHDCYESSVNAALRIVDILKESGYEFVTVEELILP